MRKVFALICITLLICGCHKSFGNKPQSVNNPVHATGSEINHVILLWLKRPGNLRMQQSIIDETTRFSNYPGLLALHVGRAMPSTNRIVDDSFDVAIYMRFANQASLNNYLQDRQRAQGVRTVVMPLVEKITVYDFFDRYAKGGAQTYPQAPYAPSPAPQPYGAPYGQQSPAPYDAPPAYPPAGYGQPPQQSAPRGRTQYYDDPYGGQ